MRGAQEYTSAIFTENRRQPISFPVTLSMHSSKSSVVSNSGTVGDVNTVLLGEMVHLSIDDVISGAWRPLTSIPYCWLLISCERLETNMKQQLLLNRCQRLRFHMWRPLAVEHASSLFTCERLEIHSQHQRRANWKSDVGYHIVTSFPIGAWLCALSRRNSQDARMFSKYHHVKWIGNGIVMPVANAPRKWMSMAQTRKKI